MVNENFDNLIIDVYNLFHRSYHVSKNHDLDNISKNTISLFLKMVKSLERDYLEREGKVYFLFDNPNSIVTRRSKIDPQYKSSRKSKDSSFFRTIDILQLVLRSYKDSYYTLRIEEYEADDLVPEVLKRVEGTSLLVTNDVDWFRSVGDKVKIAKYTDGSYEVVGKEFFEEKFGFLPTEKNIQIYKAFRGDKSDDIPKGVTGIPSKDILKMIDFNSIEDIIRNLHRIDISDTWKTKIKENYPRLALNFKLVGFLPIDQNKISEELVKSEFQPRSLKSLFSSLGFPASYDPRLMQLFPNKTRDRGSGFFEYEEIPRA